MKRILLAATCVFGLTGAANAATATWDFEADATAFTSTNGFEGTFDQVYGGATSTKSGISLSASAYKDADLNGIPDLTGAAVTTFMDAGNAGLGVCSTGFDATQRTSGESQCSSQYNGNGTHAPGDDNLVFSEILKLAFTGVPGVSIDELLVRDGGHGFTAGQIRISTDGTNFGLYSVAAVTGAVDLTGLGSASMFWFTSTDGPSPEIYLDTLTVSSVPVPAALPLLLAGLGGLGFVGRRRRKAA